MVKMIDKAGIPVVHVCTIVPISKSVGANRIYPAIAIPYPVGFPNLCAKEEKNSRKELIKKALDTLTVEIKEQKIFR